MTEHKPCPFCGGRLQRVEVQRFYFVCASCEARGPLRCSTKEAWEAWNERAKQ